MQTIVFFFLIYMAAPNWDVKKFERDLERQVKRRHYITRSTSSEFRVAADIQAYDQFLIIGLPPTDTVPSSEPEVLVAFPPISHPHSKLEQIISMCLPTGINRQYLLKNGNEPIQDEFVFTIVNGPEVTYGSCVHVNVDSTKIRKLPFYASNKSSNFAFCILSRSPALSAHFIFLSYLVLSTFNLYDLSNIPKLDLPFYDSSNLIENMDLDNQIAHHRSITIPEYFSNALKYYYSKDSSSSPFEFGKDAQIFFPPVGNLECLLWLSLDTIFSLLNVDFIMKLVTSIIFDAQVLVIGHSLQEVSMTVIALQYLIRPFRFCGPVIPILPDTSDFFELLNSPTPFIIGVAPCKELSSFVFLEGCIFVYLDRKNASFATEASFPNEKEVVKQIKKILEKEKSRISHPFSFPSIFKKFLNHKYEFTPDTSKRIVDTIMNQIKILITDDIYSYFVTDIDSTDGSSVTIFNTELFLASVKNDCKKFYQKLLESQNFQIFIEEKILKMQQSRDSQSPLTSDIAPPAKRPRRRSISILKDALLT